MTPSIVCAVDDSPSAGRALQLATRLAERLGLQQVLVHVAPARAGGGVVATLGPPPVDAEEPGRLTRAGLAFLESVAESERLGDADLRGEYGDPGERILEVADRESAALIVVGTRGRGRVAAGVLGSVSAWVAGNAPCPVVIVPERANLRADEDGTIVCGLDDASDASAVLRVAALLRDRLRARLVAAHVGPSPVVPGSSVVPSAREQLREAASRQGQALLAELVAAAQLGTDVERRVVFGPAARSLAKLCQDEEADLLVLGSRGRGGLRSALLGSVTAEIVGLATCPVVIVPPAARQAEAEGLAAARAT